MRLDYAIVFISLSFYVLLEAQKGQSNHKLYKRLVLDANHWQRFVHKTMTFDVDSIIECGGHCNYQGAQCDLFAFLKDTSTCHIGTLDNGNTAFLTGLSGDHPLHFRHGKSFFLEIYLHTYVSITK